VALGEEADLEEVIEVALEAVIEVVGEEGIEVGLEVVIVGDSEVAIEADLEAVGVAEVEEVVLEMRVQRLPIREVLLHSKVKSKLYEVI
jgi:hypothetical protein